MKYIRSEMNSNDFNDIAIEILEVFLNHILYVRNFYPMQIFKKRRAYNTPIYISIYPPLSTYLFNVLRTAQELKRNKELVCVEAVLSGDDKDRYESYIFQLRSNVAIAIGHEQDDNSMLKLEEQLRAALYILAERTKPLSKLPHCAKFKVLLHTTQDALMRLSHNSYHQDFPWLLESLNSGVNKSKTKIIPLTKIDSMGIQIFAEVF